MHIYICIEEKLESHKVKSNCNCMIKIISNFKMFNFK